MKWIRKEVLLPQDGETIICLCKRGGIMVLKEVKVNWHFNKYNVTHWFYPETPEEEVTETKII